MRLKRAWNCVEEGNDLKAGQLTSLRFLGLANHIHKLLGQSAQRDAGNSFQKNGTTRTKFLK